MLRHPVDRAYSNYGFVVQRRNFRGSFEEFLAGRPDVLEKGFYSPHLQQYVDRFGRDRILALLFEESVRAATGPGRRSLASWTWGSTGSPPRSAR